MRSGHNLFSDRDSSAPTASRAPSGVDRLIKKHNKVGHVKANYNNIVEEARLESSVEEAGETQRGAKRRAGHTIITVVIHLR